MLISVTLLQTGQSLKIIPVELNTGDKIKIDRLLYEVVYKLYDSDADVLTLYVVLL